MDCEEELSLLFKTFCVDRFVRVLYKDHVAEGLSPEEGTPSAGILSPLLWNFYFRKVAEAAKGVLLNHHALDLLIML